MKIGNANPNEKDRVTRIRERRGEIQSARPDEPVSLQTRKNYNAFEGSASLLRTSKNRGRMLDARWVSGFLALVLSAMLGAYSFMPIFRVEQPVISGMDSINSDEIGYYTGARGKPVFMLDPQAMEKTLMKRYSDIRSAEVTIELPATLDIHLTERIPTVEWDFGGSQFWIDEDGKVLNESHSQATTIHVVANSFPGAKNAADREIPYAFSRDTFQSMLTIGRLVPQNKTLYYTYENGYGWDTDQGWRLFYGKTDTDIEEKQRMAESITKYLLENDIQPAILSLEFKDAPYYRFSE